MKWAPAIYDTRYCGPNWGGIELVLSVGRWAFGLEWHRIGVVGQARYHLVRLFLGRVALCWTWDETGGER
jgi:hypothetical protein